MAERRTIRIKFVDYWKRFEAESYLITQMLRKHYDVVVTDDADYVFFSAFSETHWKTPDRCVKIFHTGENLVPDFNACDYAIGFEWMDYEDRYIRFPLYLFYEKEMLEKVLHKHELPSDWDLHKEKPHFCSFVVSNSSNEVRNRMFRELSSYRQVDSGGRYMNNVGGPVADKFAFDSSHKFSICFENGAHNGYTTEKLMEAFAARTVPIYWGDPTVGRIFNTRAFVNVADYPSMDAVIERVKELDRNDELYMEMLREPVFRSDAPTYEQEYQRLEQWLLNIFEQPLEKAWRRNRFFQGRIYIEHRIILANISSWKKRMKKIRSLLRWK